MGILPELESSAGGIEGVTPNSFKWMNRHVLRHGVTCCA